MLSIDNANRDVRCPFAVEIRIREHPKGVPRAHRAVSGLQAHKAKHVIRLSGDATPAASDDALDPVLRHERTRRRLVWALIAGRVLTACSPPLERTAPWTPTCGIL
ncbi:uncharacterized protein LOC144094025 [Amblyomma americanum]